MTVRSFAAVHQAAAPLNAVITGVYGQYRSVSGNKNADAPKQRSRSSGSAASILTSHETGNKENDRVGNT